MTALELWIHYQAFQLDRWQHTAKLQQIHLVKPVPYFRLHPYFEHGAGRPGIPIPKKPLFKLKALEGV